MHPPTRPRDPYEAILEGSRRLDIPLESSVVGKMVRHLSLVELWNTRVNLTAIHDPLELAVFHVLDSLTVLKVLPSTPGLSLLDIGSGAGFPGVILRTARESLRLTLLDRNPRKIVFLKLLVRELGLADVRFLNVTLEDLISSPTRPVFDVVTSRAFSSEASVIDAVHVLLRPEGWYVHLGGPATALPGPLQFFEPVRVWEGKLPFLPRFRRVTLLQRRKDDAEAHGPEKPGPRSKKT